jgi:hypothetical protein
MMQIFLSHATGDREVIAEISKQLNRIGVRVYLAEHDNQAGGPLADKVQAALAASDLVVALLTPAGYDSVYVHHEVGGARLAGKMVIPLVDESVRRSDLGALVGLEYIVLNQQAPEIAMNLLTERVVALLQAQADLATVAAVAAVTEAEAARRQADREKLLAVLAVALVLAAGAYLYYDAN